MSNYIIVIPSYHREELIKIKTLHILLSRNINPKSIYIFVSDKHEFKLYNENISKELYNKIIIGKKGISYQRNFIINYFDEGQYLIFIDDDISNIKVKRNNKVSDLDDLNSFFIKGYNDLIKENKFLWATKNMYNPFYKNLMKNNAFVGFLEFSADLIGIINRKNMKIKYTLEKGEGEQIELLFMYQKRDNGVIRYDNVIVISAKLTPGGKIDEQGGKDNRINSLLYNYKILEKYYPEYIKNINLKTDKFSNRAKLVLNNFDNETKQIEGGKINELNINQNDKEGIEIIIDKINLISHVKKIQMELYELLENTHIPRIEGNRSDGKKTRGDLIGYKGWTFNMGIGRRRNLGFSEFSANSKNPELFKKVIEYGNLILPSSFKYTAITINRDIKAKKHVDGGNNGYGAITFLGDYEGGGIYLYKDNNDTNGKLYNTHNKLIIFNGAKIPHMTEDFKGRRYALIYYNQSHGKEIKNLKMEGL